MKATFEHSVDVLVKAFLNDTLQHCNCHACAVGNLIADANELVYDREWCSIIVAKEKDGKSFPMDWYGSEDAIGEERGKKEMLSTGYQPHEIWKIERAFESAVEGTKDERMYDGLMRVVEALADIHKVDLSVKEEAKSMFVKEMA